MVDAPGMGDHLADERGEQAGTDGAGIACIVSYLFSGHSGIYHAQRIGNSKYLPQLHDDVTSELAPTKLEPDGVPFDENEISPLR